MENEEFLKLIHTDVIRCIKEVGRAQGFIKMNYNRIVKIDEYVVKCDDRLADLEIWKAGHDGHVEGRKTKFTIFSAKTTLLCTIGALVLGAAGFYFTNIKPTAEVTAGLVREVASISQKFEEVVSQLEN